MTYGFCHFAYGGAHVCAVLVWVVVCAIAAHAADYDTMQRLDTASNEYIAHGATAKKDAGQKFSILQRDGFDCTKTADTGVRTKMIKMEQEDAMADKDYDAFNNLQVELNIIREITKDCNDNNLATASDSAAEADIRHPSNTTHILSAIGNSIIDDMSFDSGGDVSESGNSGSSSDSSGSAGSSSSDGLDEDNGDDRRFWGSSSSGSPSSSSPSSGGGGSSGSRFSSLWSCSDVALLLHENSLVDTESSVFSICQYCGVFTRIFSTSATVHFSLL